MEDENGLELSLGLSYGGSSAKNKSKNGSSSDTRAEEVGRGGKTVDDFKSMFDNVPQKPESISGTRRTDSQKPEENFFSDLSKAKEENASLNLNGRGFLAANNSKPIEIEDDKHSEAANKRKMSFDEIRNQKKHDSDFHHDRARTSHASVTEDGSTAENEDVADSETDNSTSRPISHHSDGSKGFIRVGSSSEAAKEVRGSIDANAADYGGQKRFIGSSEKDFKHASMTYGASFSVQPVNMMNVPYASSPVKEPSSVGAPGPQIPGVMHAMPTATSERSGPQSVNNGGLPVMFGYPPVQLPMLEKDNSWGLVSRSQQLHPSFVGRGPTPNNPAALQIISNSISEVKPYEGRPLDRPKGDGKQRVIEEGSSSQTEDVKGRNTNLRAKDVSDQSTGEGAMIDFSNIKPGIAADVKFGGGGSYPNLPWVSTSGSGPNGRTISGVTYRYSTNQVRIVCACHGSHMTPEEFVRHANEDQTTAEGSAALGTVANGNPATSSHG